MLKHLCTFTTVLLFAITLRGAEDGAEEAEISLPEPEAVQALMDKGVTWLKAQQQEDGSFVPGEQFKLGVSELALIALLDAGVPADDPVVKKGVDYIMKFRQDDGSIYNPEEGLQNYCTSLGLRVLTRTGADQEVIKSAQEAILSFQNTKEGSINEGGFGYGSRGPGNNDLSNSIRSITALRESGIEADHPAMQRALKFVQRCQNLSSVNDLEWAKNGPNDGSGVYSPDSSKAFGTYHGGYIGSKPKEKKEEGKAAFLPGYGTMTYALITSYIYLDVDKDDPRVQAALDWCRRNYQFEVNPGMPARQLKEGLFYYYLTMAKTYDLTDTTSFTTGGRYKDQVDWREGLFEAIKERAKEGKDGGVYWINSAKRWGEGIPALTTSYMISSLKRIKDSL